MQAGRLWGVVSEAVRSNTTRAQEARFTITPPNSMNGTIGLQTRHATIECSRRSERERFRLNAGKPGWSRLLRQEGSEFLAWIEAERILSRRFAVLASALSSLLRDRTRTPGDARDVWEAVPAVLRRCNEQATYEKPGAAVAYAWLHLLDRYVRTWRALERLVHYACLPMGRHGVRALDIGTGPGPAAFAIHDFCASMVEFSEKRSKPEWRQPADVTCFESDPSTNHFRHHLAEILYQQSPRASEGLLSICSALRDFRDFESTRERKESHHRLRSDEVEYIDEVTGDMHSESIYLPEEANAMAQSLHRYRLFVFSNFLTTPETVASLEQNIAEMLRDANPGTVLLVLGGKEKQYPEIYEGVDRIAGRCGFQLTVKGETVSCSNSDVAGQVSTERQEFYQFLQNLDYNNEDDTRDVRRACEGDEPDEHPCSEIHAYRKRHFSETPPS